MANKQKMEYYGNIVKEDERKRIVEAVREEIEKLCGSGAKAEFFCTEKNNGVMNPGMIIREPGKGASPLIYLAPYVREIQEGKTIKETAEAIYTVHQNYSGQEPAIAHEYLNADQIRDKVVYRLINLEKNQSALTNMPYQVIGEDLAIVFYVILERNEQGIMSININREHLNCWGMKAEELWELANKNTPRLFPIEMKCLADVVFDLMEEQLKESIPDLEKEMLDRLLEDYHEQIHAKEPVEAQMFVLTNTYKTWGASTILYPGALKEVAGQFGSDLVILPSSVHEVIFMRHSNIPQYENMAEIVKEINQREVLPEDILSNSVYVYCSKDDELRKVAEAKEI